MNSVKAFFRLLTEVSYPALKRMGVLAEESTPEAQAALRQSIRGGTKAIDETGAVAAQQQRAVRLTRPKPAEAPTPPVARTRAEPTRRPRADNDDAPTGRTKPTRTPRADNDDAIDETRLRRTADQPRPLANAVGTQEVGPVAKPAAKPAAAAPDSTAPKMSAGEGGGGNSLGRGIGSIDGNGEFRPRSTTTIDDGMNSTGGGGPGGGPGGGGDGGMPRTSYNPVAVNADKNQSQIKAIQSAIRRMSSKNDTEALTWAEIDKLQGNFYEGQIIEGARSTHVVNDETVELTKEELLARLGDLGDVNPSTGFSVPKNPITTADWNFLKRENLLRRADPELGPKFGDAGSTRPEFYLKVDKANEINQIGETLNIISTTRGQLDTARGSARTVIESSVGEDGKTTLKFVGYRTPLEDPAAEAAALNELATKGHQELQVTDMELWLRDPEHRVTISDWDSKVNVPNRLKNAIPDVTGPLRTASTPRGILGTIFSISKQNVLSTDQLKALEDTLTKLGKISNETERTINPATGKFLKVNEMDMWLRHPDHTLSLGDLKELKSHQAWRRPLSMGLPAIKQINFDGQTLLAVPKIPAVVIAATLATSAVDTWVNPDQPMTGRVGRWIYNKLDLDTIGLGDGITATQGSIKEQMLSSRGGADRYLQEYLHINVDGQSIDGKTGKPVTNAQGNPITYDPIEARLRIAQALQGSGSMNPEVKEAMRLWLAPQIKGAAGKDDPDGLAKAAMNEFINVRADAMRSNPEVLKSMVSKGLSINDVTQASVTDISNALVTNHNPANIYYMAALRYYAGQAFGPDSTESDPQKISNQLIEKDAATGDLAYQQSIIAQVGGGSPPAGGAPPASPAFNIASFGQNLKDLGFSDPEINTSVTAYNNAATGTGINHQKLEEGLKSLPANKRTAVISSLEMVSP